MLAVKQVPKFIKTKIFFLFSVHFRQNFHVDTMTVGRGGGRGAAVPPSWAEIRFTRANFLKAQLEVRAESLQKVNCPP